jgi:hypothetical protein
MWMVSKVFGVVWDTVEESAETDAEDVGGVEDAGDAEDPEDAEVDAQPINVSNITVILSAVSIGKARKKLGIFMVLSPFLFYNHVLMI